MIKSVLISCLLCIVTGESIGQISPPGLDGAKVVGWAAVGFTQTVSPRWSVTTYAGTSTQSTFANDVFWKKPAISVINQEWAYQFASHWQLVMAGSLRSQSLYEETPPYEPKQPAVRREIRGYARLFFRHQQGSKLNWAHSFRPEYRRFFGPGWQEWPTPVQIRLRLKSQLSYPLNPAKTTLIIAANEVLTTIDGVNDLPNRPLKWSPYRVSEDRLSMFIRRTLHKPAVNLDAGLMHQFWWDANAQKIRYTAYLSVDLLFRDLLKKPGK